MKINTVRRIRIGKKRNKKDKDVKDKQEESKDKKIENTHKDKIDEIDNFIKEKEKDKPEKTDKKEKKKKGFFRRKKFDQSEIEVVKKHDKEVISITDEEDTDGLVQEVHHRYRHVRMGHQHRSSQHTCMNCLPWAKDTRITLFENFAYLTFLLFQAL